MGFFDIFRPKKRSFDQLSEFGLGLPTATGQTVTVDGSLALPAVFVCVRVLAESIGSMSGDCRAPPCIGNGSSRRGQAGVVDLKDFTVMPHWPDRSRPR